MQKEIKREEEIVTEKKERNHWTVGEWIIGNEMFFNSKDPQMDTFARKKKRKKESDSFWRKG